MSSATTPIGPLAQRHRQRTVGSALAELPLSPADRATLERLLAGPIDYADNPDFHADDAHARLFQDTPDLPRPNTGWYNPMVLETRDPAEVKTDANVVLTKKQEIALFLQFNYVRFRAEQVRQEIEAQDNRPTVEQARELLDWWRRAMAHREQIAEFNLALVLAMIKRVRSTGLEFSELLSEGNLALLRAIDKFDVARGFKFSTYACRAILKAFSRFGTKTTRRKGLFPVEFDPDLERSDYSERKNASHEDDCADEVKRIVTDNDAELTDLEDTVIRRRFALDPADERPLTLEEVGRLVGFTKERVRQIQNRALEKIRVTLEEGYLDGRPATEEELTEDAG